MRKAVLVIIALITTSVIGCSKTVWHIFQPNDSDGQYSYYYIGTPYVFTSNECAHIQMAMRPATIADKSYLQLFLYYENISSEAFLLYPLESMKIEIVSKKITESVTPELPTKMVSRIKNSGNAMIFAQALVGGIQAATTSATRVTGNGSSLRIDDSFYKQQIILDQTANNINQIAASTSITSNAVSSEMLRRHTIFPGNAIAGYVYFDSKGLAYPPGYTSTVPQDYMNNTKFTVTINTPCGIESFEFVPAQGE